MGQVWGGEAWVGWGPHSVTNTDTHTPTHTQTHTHTHTVCRPSLLIADTQLEPVDLSVKFREVREEVQDRPGLAAVLEKLPLVTNYGGGKGEPRHRREHRCEYPGCMKSPVASHPKQGLRLKKTSGNALSALLQTILPWTRVRCAKCRV